MRSLFFLLLTAPLLTVAQNLGSEPPCAVPCLRAAIEASICEVNDQGCQCTPEGKASIQAGATACLIANCTAAELVNVQKIGNDLCVAYSSSVSSGAAGSGTGNASPTTTTTSTRRSTEQTTSTVVAITTSIPSPGATTGTGVSSTGATGSGSGSGSPTATGASLSSTSSGNAAPTMVINYVAVVGGFAALLL
ncbi:hypothetical protein B0O99DRAFT_607047 [Bisporella sp. PMI_857]|nr:hypothetical protein B0O99DRAFT_607047 [Bisporella sp. PMI_857]